MLSSCVEDAALTTAAAVSGEPLPDHHAWDSGSGSDEEGSGGSVGHSWEAAMTPAELAALEGGFVPASLAAALGGQQAQQQQQARPLFPEGDDSLPAEEKLALLKAEFKSVSSEEVAAALAACDSSLFAAAELLRVFAAEDAAAGRNGGALNGRAAAAAASVPAAAALPVPAAAASSGSFLPPHARPEVAHPTRLFPDAPSESLEVRLSWSAWDGFLDGWDGDASDCSAAVHAVLDPLSMHLQGAGCHCLHPPHPCPTPSSTCTGGVAVVQLRPDHRQPHVAASRVCQGGGAAGGGHGDAASAYATAICAVIGAAAAARRRVCGQQQRTQRAGCAAELVRGHAHAQPVHLSAGACDAAADAGGVPPLL